MSGNFGVSAPDFENPLCMVSQEWTYGIDNTGTRFSDAGELKITLDDGRCLNWTQTPTGGWSDQLTQWAAGIQAAADALGLQWLVEPRFVDNPNPSNIDGTINGPGGTPSGLPGAPDPIIAQALIDGGMAWRYVNIQICPGEPVPVRAERITSAEGRPVPFDLTTAGAVLGPKNRFRVFYGRDKITDEPCEAWYIYDISRPDPTKRWREANAGEVPFCFFKDGDAASTAVPPESDCFFEFDTNCDNNGQTDPANYKNLVTRRVTYCSGEKIAQDFFVPDPADPAALIEYTLQGEYVDCATGEPVPLPPPPCEDFDLTTLWTIENKTPGLYNREWADLGPAFPFTSDPSGPEAYIDAFDDMQPPTTDTIVTVNTFALNDTDNTPSRIDYQKRWGRVCIEKPQTIEFGTNSEGYMALWVGICGRPLERVISYAKPVGLQRTPRYTLPPGIHDIRLDNLDWGGSNSNWTLYRVDGETAVADNDLFDPMTSTTLPYERCKQVKVCKDTDALVDLLTGDVLKRDDCRPCALPPCPVAASSGGNVDEKALADAIVAKQRDVTPRVMNFTNEGGVESLRDAAGNLYPAGTLGTLVSVEDIGTGFVRWTIDGSVPTTQEGTGFTTTGPYHAAYNLHNVDLSLVRLDGSSANSDYAVAFEVYN